MKKVLLIVVLITAAVCAWPLVETPEGYTKLQEFNKSALYRVETRKSYTDKPINLIVLKGSRYEIGYAYGRMLGMQILENYASFLKHMFPKTYTREAIIIFLQYQWDHYLSKQVPAEFFDEIRGVKDGGESAGFKGLEKVMTQMLTLANFPSDPVHNIQYLLLDELAGMGAKTGKPLPHGLQTIEEIRETVKHWKAMSCSFFAAWGSRTLDGSLLSARNLDWATDTGISKHKLVSIYHIDGKIPYASLGFAGLIGTLTGMNKAGLTVHETGLDVKAVTFRGFAWTLRLRYIMENAKSLDEAKQIWQATNNTMGMNHMVASAKDVSVIKPGEKTARAAIAFETMRGYTGFFYDNDSREANFTVFDKKTNKTVHLGSPLPEVIWRTNHAYDKPIAASQLKANEPGTNSQQRYDIFHNLFANFEKQQHKMDEFNAVNVTAILGDKGSNWFVCDNKPEGSNVLSSTYHPSIQRMYVAYETGEGESWRPACCGTYVRFDLESFFASEPFHAKRS